MKSRAGNGPWTLPLPTPRVSQRRQPQAYYLAGSPSRPHLRSAPFWSEEWGPPQNDPATTDADKNGEPGIEADPAVDPITIGVAAGWVLREWSLGWELTFGRNPTGSARFRLAPFGNRTDSLWGQLPHYHRGATAAARRLHRPYQGGF